MAVSRYVQTEDTFAAFLPIDLSQQTGAGLNLQREYDAGFSVSTALRFHEILAAQPDLVLWVLHRLT
jgi:hypothetical protein